jgi:signal transduction histidine kinase
MQPLVAEVTLDQGEIDVSQWSAQEPIPLKGPWAFYWQKFILPPKDSTPPDAWVEAGRSWNGISLSEGTKLAGEGYATYHMRLRALPYRPGGYEISIIGAASTYKLTAVRSKDGKIVAEAQSGDPVHHPQTMVQRFLTLSLMPLEQEDYDLYIWVSNMTRTEGGLWFTPFLAPAGKAFHGALLAAILEFIAWGSAASTGIYCFMLWWRRRDDKPALFLSIAALSAVLRITSTTLLLRGFFPDSSHAYLLRLEYFSMPAGIISYLYFLLSIYDNAAPDFLKKTFGYAGLFFAGLSLLTPIRFFTSQLWAFQLFVGATAGFYGFIISQGFRKQNKDILLVGMGCFLIVCGFAYDISQAFNSSPISRLQTTPAAVAFFLILQAQLVAKRAAAAYARAEEYAQQLHEKERARTLFFHNTSHELRTPLNGIIGFMELIEQGRYGQIDSKPAEQIRKCIRLALSLKHQVNTILDLAKSKKGMLTLRNKIIRLDELIKYCEDLALGLQLKHQNSEFVIRKNWVKEETIFCNDQEMLAIIMRNLLGNAFKFADPKRKNHIEVDFILSQGTLEISVKDSGIGIAETDQGRIFEEFEQVAGDARRVYEGTGLGLAMVRDIVKLMSGRIALTSKHGEGSHFTLQLPEQHADQFTEHADHPTTVHEVLPINDSADRSRSADSVGPRNPQGAHILVVDDLEMNCELLGDILSEEGYQISMAFGGAEALQILEYELPDLILLDMMMPHVSGEDVIKALQNQPKHSDIPIILITARASEDDRLFGLSLGADDYLAKPIHSGELLFRVKNILKRRQISKQLAAAEENEKLAQLGKLMSELSHELKNAFHGNVYNLGEERKNCADILQRLPIKHSFWIKAAEQISKSCYMLPSNEEMSQFSFTSDAQKRAPILRGLRTTLAQIEMPVAEKIPIWVDILELSPAQQIECDQVIQLIKAFLNLFDSVQYANSLISSVLEYSRFNESTQNASLEADLAQVLKLLQPRMQKFGIQVRLVIRPLEIGLPAGSFKQVLMNLLSNACDALEGKPKDDRWIQIECQSDQGQMVLRFTNGGPPIDETKIAALFQEGWSSKGSKGYGLGLAISQRIVQRYHGFIRLDKEAKHPSFVLKLRIAEGTESNLQKSKHAIAGEGAA